MLMRFSSKRNVQLDNNLVINPNIETHFYQFNTQSCLILLQKFNRHLEPSGLLLGLVPSFALSTKCERSVIQFRLVA